MRWRINRIQYPVHNLGPGKRVAIWVQGCSIKCPGCVSPSLWTVKEGQAVEIDKLAWHVSQIGKDCQGVTITGGEPFDQYPQLVAFAAMISELTHLDLFAFSGYTLEQLEERHPDRLWSRYLDYLVDGPYREDLADDSNWRGSSNQRFFRFKNGQPRQSEPDYESQQWSLAQAEDGSVYMSGIPRQGELQSISRELRELGIDVRFH